MAYLPREKTKKGFTLIELIVVISIISILIALSVAYLSSARRRSRDARRMLDLRTVSSALNMYYDTKKSMPAEKSACLTPDCDQIQSGTEPYSTAMKFVVDLGYLEDIPLGPKGNDYWYKNYGPNTAGGFLLRTVLESYPNDTIGVRPSKRFASGELSSDTWCSSQNASTDYCIPVKY